MRWRHWCTAHIPVKSVRKRWVNISAGGSDFGFQFQIRSNTPRRKITHFSTVIIFECVNIIFAYGKFFIGLSAKIFTVGFADKDTGDFVIGGHIYKRTVNIIINDCGKRTGIFCVAFLLSKRQNFPVFFTGTLNQSNFTFKVFVWKICCSTDAAIDIFKCAGKRYKPVAFFFCCVIITNFSAIWKQIDGCRFNIVHTRNRKSGFIGWWWGYHTVIGFCRFRQIVSGCILICWAVFVSGCTV